MSDGDASWSPGGPHDREAAWRLLTEHNDSDSLRKHGLAVEAAMRGHARRYGEDEELWGIVGLIHDFDYEKHPDPLDHGLAGGRILRELGWPDIISHAVESHNDHVGVLRENLMEHALFSSDELCGFIVAVALVKGRDLTLVEPRSVYKKMKDKGFARSVSREDIEKGWRELGVDPDEHINQVVESLKLVAPDIGLTHSG
ncbi:MAG TPA: HDIG domain-containing protein [Candidatus Solibacter sp.]|nr:HDIG domain-containing protein [Candidatus Solibacter sp.]